MKPFAPFRWLMLAFLLLQFGLALHGLKDDAPTIDEQGFLVRGLAYVRGENQHIRVGHPAGLNLWNALLLANDATVQLPTADPSWQATSFHRPAELFMWEIGNDVRHVIFLARLPTVWLLPLLAAMAAGWAYCLSKNRWAMLMALCFVAFDPNLLANGRLTTTDFGLTLAVTCASFALWRYLRQPTWRNVLIAGFFFGLLQDTKFTAGLFVPLFTLVIFSYWGRDWWQQKRFPWASVGRLVVGYPLAGILTLWASYGFQIGTLPPNLPTLPQLSGLTLPLAHHLEQLLDIGGRLQVGTPAFLMGQYSDSGWWYYFIVTFLLKTPLPTLLLILTGFLLFLFSFRRNPSHSSLLTPHSSLIDFLPLLLPAFGYFAIALTTSINLGYRHLLPIVPLLIVASVSLVAPVFRRLSWALAAWLFLNTVWIAPLYLAFFNGLAGGPTQGWHYLVDSNIDWGQDLYRLKNVLAEKGIDTVWLSYFGEGRPSTYGIPYIGLDSFPPRLMDSNARPFYPADPAPGVYAISVTNLQGVQFANHEQFAWFRGQTPIGRAGYSILLYEVKPRGVATAVALGNVQIDELPPDAFAAFQTNDVRLRWFDARQSLLIPAQPAFWVALPKAQEAPFLPQLAATQVNDVPTATYTLRQYASDDWAKALALPAQPMAQLSFDSGKMTLWQATVQEEGNGRYTVQTVWQKEGSAPASKLFIHLTDSDGQIVAQWDGLGAVWQGWQAGDYLLQASPLTLPPDTPAGTYQLWDGFYEPTSLTRWQSPQGDRILLGEITTP